MAKRKQFHGMVIFAVGVRGEENEDREYAVIQINMRIYLYNKGKWQYTGRGIESEYYVTKRYEDCYVAMVDDDDLEAAKVVLASYREVHENLLPGNRW